MSMVGRLHRAARHRPHADIAVAAVVCAVTLLTTVAGPATSRGRLGAGPALLAAVACAALVWRRRWPVAVLLTTAVTAEAYLYVVRGPEAVLAAPLIALYAVADSADRRHALTIGGLAVAALAGIHLLPGRPYSWLGSQTLALVALGGLAVAAGDAARSSRAHTAEVEARARRAEAGREQAGAAPGHRRAAAHRPRPA